MKNSRWKKPPGSIDPLHASQTYQSSNEWGIPDLQPQPADLQIPANLYTCRYGQRAHTTRPILIHFHTDDYRFESAWNEPRRGI